MSSYKRNDQKLIRPTPEGLIKKNMPILEYIIRNYGHATAQDIARDLGRKHNYVVRILNEELFRYKIVIKDTLNRQLIYSIAPQYFHQIENMVYNDPRNTGKIYGDKKAKERRATKAVYIGKLYNYIGRKELYNAAKYKHVFNKDILSQDEDPQVLTGNLENVYISLNDHYRFFIIDMRHSVPYFLQQIEKIGKIMEYSAQPYSIDIVTYSEDNLGYLEKRIFKIVKRYAEDPGLLNRYNYGKGNRLIFMNVINVNMKNFPVWMYKIPRPVY